MAKKPREHDWCGPPPGSGMGWFTGMRGALVTAGLGLVVFGIWAVVSLV